MDTLERVPELLELGGDEVDKDGRGTHLARLSKKRKVPVATPTKTKGESTARTRGRQAAAVAADVEAASVDNNRKATNSNRERLFELIILVGSPWKGRWGLSTVFSSSNIDLDLTLDLTPNDGFV